tara:strand:- start:39 stop:836 length:798 start_codon:yes stop_codon:yes gene_type:complete
MDLRYKNSLPWGAQISRGNMLHAHVHHQFGRNATCGTSYVPVSDSGIYRTPQVAGATQLRIKAGGNAADAAAGAGAQSVRLHGINAIGNEITEVIATAGTSASAATTQSFIRLYHAEVHDSGTYGTQAAGSHAGDITIEDAAGTEDWAEMLLDGFASATTCIGSLTIPRNHVGLVTSINVTIDTSGSKTMDVLFMQRSDILQTAAPYSPITKVQEFLGLNVGQSITYDIPFKVPELTDIGVLAKSSAGTNAVSVDMEIIMLEAET